MTDRQTDGRVDGRTDRQTDRQRQKQRQNSNWKTGNWKKETDRQKKGFKYKDYCFDRQTGRQRQRETEEDRDREREERFQIRDCCFA